MLTQQTISTEKSALNASELLPQIVEEHKALSLKLLEFSNVTNVSDAEQEKINSKETELLDRQSGLMEMALTTHVSSVEDAKSLLDLWYLEVVKSATPGSLDVADELVVAVYNIISNIPAVTRSTYDQWSDA